VATEITEKKYSIFDVSVVIHHYVSLSLLEYLPSVLSALLRASVVNPARRSFFPLLRFGHDTYQ
jgi:hypothetical protein